MSTDDHQQSGPGPITRVLDSISAGDSTAEEELLPLVYSELRRIAGARMAKERGLHTLQPTALVHEAYFRLAGPSGLSFDNRAHFFAAAADAMRRILVESARRRNRIKRGGEFQRADVDAELLRAPNSDPEQLLVLDDLISKLEQSDQDIATVVKLRHFVGMTVQEVAEALDTSPRSLHRRWNTGKAWLKRELLRSERKSE